MKTNKKDFKLFKQECLYWQKEFGLVAYEIKFKHIELDNGEESIITSDATQFWAVVSLAKERKYKFDVALAAKHEMIHLLLAKMHMLANTRFINPDEIVVEDEKLARVLEKVIKK